MFCVVLEYACGMVFGMVLEHHFGRILFGGGMVLTGFCFDFSNGCGMVLVWGSLVL